MVNQKQDSAATVDQHRAASDHLAALGYESEFERSMGLWANIALGFTYLSPLVGVYSLFATGLAMAGPPAFWWLIIVGSGQLMVALVFGEVVSQYPLAGGIYQWVRRLWNAKAAWMVAWVYGWAMIVTITSVAEFGGGFAASLFGLQSTPLAGLITAVGLLVVALGFNFSGTRVMAVIAQIGLTAELVGVVLLGLFLLIFRRHNSFSIFVHTMGAGGSTTYLWTFLGAALTGLFLFYGFEACGDVAEEVADPGRRIPRAMWLTIVVGGVSGILSFGGYMMAAPNLPGIVSGKEGDPIPAILDASLGHVGAKIFLVVAMMSFLSCVLSLQAAASRLIYAFARDKMVPGSQVFASVSPRHRVPVNALLVACVVPILLCLWIYFDSGALVQITSFAVLGIYLAFQSVVFAALRMRRRGWEPGGEHTLGRSGLPINVIALAYGIFAIILLAWPSGNGVSAWVVLIGAGVVLGSGGLYLVLARPDRQSTGPTGDAVEVAELLRGRRAQP